VYFSSRLPDLQVHHGTEDDVVLVSQAERLIEVMKELGRAEPEFEPYIYEGGDHGLFFTIPTSVDRAVAFMSRLLAPTLAVRLQM
jgi:dipeptidyl aminopeptidase/acylaminoacyl peptidase